jgi:hypothetical protein
VNAPALLELNVRGKQEEIPCETVERGWEVFSQAVKRAREQGVTAVTLWRVSRGQKMARLAGWTTTEG